MHESSRLKWKKESGAWRLAETFRADKAEEVASLFLKATTESKKRGELSEDTKTKAVGVWERLNEALNRLVAFAQQGHDLAEKTRYGQLWADVLGREFENLKRRLFDFNEFYGLGDKSVEEDYDPEACAGWGKPHPEHTLDPLYGAYRNIIKLQQFKDERRNLKAPSGYGEHTWGELFLQQVTALQAALHLVQQRSLPAPVISDECED